ncbi:MAG TPA: Gfo/Idh/MocA family oxidoreductase [Candidatus Dormibacteraeota bacterium]|nr:Gfo/Idh/MocA family oxidoreductase [Candidatus Dormibacteraeota bacterium]
MLAVGLGECGRHWVGGMLPQVPEVQLAGCVDVDPAALDVAVERLGVPAGRCFTSLAAALAATAPDAVLVATTLPGHVPVARAALESGCHILLEKPFAPSLAEAQELVALAERRGLVLMVSQNYRFFPAARAAADLVRGGTLGAPHEVQVDFRHGATAPPGVGHRRLAQPLLLDMAIHHLDLLRLLLGREATRVSCEAWNPRWSGFAGPPAAVAAIRFGDDLLASYRGSWLGRGPHTQWAGEWRIGFEAGEAWWTSRRSMHDAGGDRLVVWRPGCDVEELELPAEGPIDRAGCLAAFAAAVRTGARPESSGRDNLASLALSLATVESATRGVPVAIDEVGSW